MTDPAPRRVAAAASSPSYPTLSAHGEGRRRFLKLCALSSAAAALGLELVGCPSKGAGGGVKVSPPDWLPWDSDDGRVLAGEMMMPMGTPVAVIVGDGPIAITWGDGTKTELVVAAVVTPMEGTDVRKDFAGMAKNHIAVVKKTAAAQPKGVLGDPKALDALEAALLTALNQTLTSGGYVNEISAAEAERGPRKEEASPLNEALEEEAPAREVMQEASAPSQAAPPREQAVATPRRAPQAKTFWSACRSPGCTSCGE